MKVQIIKCSSKEYWYKNLVGKKIRVHDIFTDEEDNHLYMVKGHRNILKKDCKFISYHNTDDFMVSRKKLLQIIKKNSINSTYENLMNDLKEITKYSRG